MNSRRLMCCPQSEDCTVPYPGKKHRTITSLATLEEFVALMRAAVSSATAAATCRNGGARSVCTATIKSRACLTWVSRVASGRSRCSWHVRYASNSDPIGASQRNVAMCQKLPCGAANTSLFDHLVGAGEQRRRHFQAKRLGGLEIDGQFVFGGHLHRQVGRLLAPENAVDVTGGEAVLVV